MKNGFLVMIVIDFVLIILIVNPFNQAITASQRILSPTISRLSSTPNHVTVIGSSDVAPNSSASLPVFCPNGMIALGGGVDISYPDDGRINASQPVWPGVSLANMNDGDYVAPTGWEGGVTNPTSFMMVFHVGVICIQDSGKVSTHITSISSPYGSAWSPTISCPGETVISGGFGSPNQNAFTLHMSAPQISGSLYSLPDGVNPAPNGWQFYLKNSMTTSQTVRFAVICIDHPILARTVLLTEFANQNITESVAHCPSGMIATAGGVDTNGKDYIYLSAMGFYRDSPGSKLRDLDVGEYFSLSQYWSFAVDNENNSSFIVRPAVVCFSPYTIFLPSVGR